MQPIPILPLALLLALPVQAQRVRCGTSERMPRLAGAADLPPSDCGYFTNEPKPEYEPTFFYDIPIVFHVIQSSSGEGFLSTETIQDQIEVLNEDFQALPGSPGAPGTDGRIRFHLAKTDPEGNPTSGITYTTNDTWYMDSGNYWSPLAWDTKRYMNVYTNYPPCCYGYVSGFPSEGIAGQDSDRVVLWWEAVGREPTPGWPLNMGRTGTHEVGHYLGLYHTFCGGCGSVTNCYSTADLICDTEREANSTSGCPSSKSSCGSPDPIHNYMDYTDDPCMWEFTPEQVNRMRCTLEHWRPDLPVDFAAQENVRVGTPPNPAALLPGVGSPPVVAGTWDPVVDHSTFEPGAVLDYLAVSLSPTEVPLGGSGTLLCGFPLLALVPNATPGTPFAIPVPNNPSLLGAAFCAQAASSSSGADFQLTNALDCVIGN
ncbi:MAG: zinc metalloprotease [Planctomycetota bacterium]